MARENWTSSLGFVLASAGAAIGLGNVWKFPYVAGANGGATFVLVYILCVLFVGLPVMSSEMLIGRFTRRNVINAMGKVERVANSVRGRLVLSMLSAAVAVLFATMHSWLFAAVAVFGVWAFARRGFAVIGWLCTAVALSILSYYAVVGGWIVEYIWRAVSGTLLNGVGVAMSESAEIAAVAEASGDAFGAYAGNPMRVLVGFLVFMSLTGTVILGGIQSGIERVSKVLMPALFILMLVVIVRSVSLPGAWDGVRFLLKPDFDKLNSGVWLVAMGQAFYSLSLGMAITVTYGSYLHKNQNIFKAAGWVGVLDTMAAMLAGLAIFPAVFAAGLQPTAGPGLIFGALPAIFAEMPLGSLWAACFFIMLLVAAVTSSVSLLECGATVFIERIRRGHRRFDRRHAVLLSFTLVTLLGLLTVFSTLDWKAMPGVGHTLKNLLGDLYRGSWFNTLDNFASNWCLPFVALATTFLIGWCWRPDRAAPRLLAHGEQVKPFMAFLMKAWGFSVRWLAPVAIFLVFLDSVGVRKALLEWIRNFY